MMSKTNVHQSFSVIVIGYDGYKDVWSYFEHFYLKANLNDYFKTIFVSSEERGPNSFDCILAHSNSASKRIEKALEETDADYIILLLEDYLIEDDSIYYKLLPFMQFVETNKIDYFCLCNFITKLRGKKISNHNDVALLPKTRNYRISLQPSIWSRKLLSAIVRNDISTLWDFENYLNHNKAYDDIPAFFPAKTKIKIVNMVDKGEITKKANKMFQKEGLPKPKRKQISLSKSNIIKIKNFLISLIPGRILNRYLNRKLKNKK